jgi:hypothetical protein
LVWILGSGQGSRSLFLTTVLWWIVRISWLRKNNTEDCVVIVQFPTCPQCDSFLKGFNNLFLFFTCMDLLWVTLLNYQQIVFIEWCFKVNYFQRKKDRLGNIYSQMSFSLNLFGSSNIVACSAYWFPYNEWPLW